MTGDEIIALSVNCPVMLADGKVGLLIRFPIVECPEVGVQVPGESDIRWLDCNELHDLGNGALIQKSAGEP